MMNSKRICAAAAAVLCLLLFLCPAAGATVRDAVQPVYTNPDTGYQVVILDECDLLTAAQEAQLTESMIPLAEYGNVVFWSTDEYAYDEIRQAREKRSEMYDHESSAIFMINTSKRKVTFHSEGRINQIVNASYARSVTDNVSHYASTGDYYRCASECFSQILTLMKGNRIAEPMKYISYIVIALMLSFVLVVGVVFSKRFNPLTKKNKDQAILYGSGKMVASPPVAHETGTQTRAWVNVTLMILRIALSSIGSGGSSGGSGRGGSSGGSGGSSSY